MFTTNHRRGTTELPLAGERRRRGAAAVELAIALPVLVLLFFGAVDLGRFASTQIAVSNSARAGAGFGSMNPPSTSTLLTWKDMVRQHAIAEMQGNIDGEANYSEADVTVTSQCVIEDVERGFRRVDVTVSFPFAMMLDMPGMPGEYEITRKVSMRALR